VGKLQKISFGRIGEKKGFRWRRRVSKSPGGTRKLSSNETPGAGNHIPKREKRISHAKKKKERSRKKKRNEGKRYEREDENDFSEA